VRDLKNTIEENEEFLRGQERMIAARLVLLPKGRIKSKRKGSEVYYYLQYRKGSAVKTDYVGKQVPGSLHDRLAERERLESELRRVREGLRLLRKRKEAAADLVDPLAAILRKLTKEKSWDAGLEIIGSWCFLLYQRYLPMEKYPLRTDDLDILIPRPFTGKAFDLAGYLQRLGFTQHFNRDGSTYFAGSRMRVEFLTREGRPQTKGGRGLKVMGVAPQELRYLEILFDEPLTLKVARGVLARVPAPASFLLHKLVISTLAARREKIEKDARQAIYVGKYVLTEEQETARLKRLWSELPKKWKSRIRTALAAAITIVPLERGVIERLRELLV
jgi:hypothetical protein